jgi:hypothetical protein
MEARVIPTLLAVSGLAVLYWFPVRRWFLRWGATPADLRRAMTGDSAGASPPETATRAVTVEAAPEDIWPWLVQMGYRRGGLYSYDWLDRLFGYLDRPSADRIIPAFQHLKIGDEIPIGRGQGFPVTALEPNRALVLSGVGKDFEWVWQFGVYRSDDRHTRLVSRNSVRRPATLGSWLFMRAIEPAAFLMTRRMLLGIKARAEELAGSRGRVPGRAA